MCPSMFNFMVETPELRSDGSSSGDWQGVDVYVLDMVSALHYGESDFQALVGFGESPGGAVGCEVGGGFGGGFGDEEGLYC